MPHLLFVLALAVQQPTSPSAPADDPFVWLEDVESAHSMEWVNAKNAATIAVLGQGPLYQTLYDRFKQILDSKDKIAYPSILGNSLYNFWQDADHERGIWRRTTWASYTSATPSWETVIDLDSLSKAEGVTWSWAGASCLEPEYRRCMLALSRGGSDATERREFDLTTRQFVAGGFTIPEAKTSATWVDDSTLLVGTNFGPGSMTTSGYARIIKLWRRGTPLSTATTVYEAPADHVSAGSFSTNDGARRYLMITDGTDFYHRAQYLYAQRKIVKIDTPADADIRLVQGQLVVYVRDPWTVSGKTWPTGSLIAMSVDDFLAGKRAFQLVTQPGPRETINSVTSTRDYLLLNILNNVRGELRRYRYQGGRWTFDKVPAPDLGTVGVVATSAYSNRYFFTFTNFIQPTTLFGTAENGSVAEVKRLPAMFDAAGLVVDQQEATSADGTKIPFFVVHRRDMKRDGTNPTLLGAYGGFEIPSTPSYSTHTGAGWLERGGVFVLANIRGGGEFGPHWHRAGLKEHRQRIYDDFAAVSQQLIRDSITSPQHLGIRGGSNGGLLMGVALTQHPELYNAVLIQNPLLDMKRYNHLLAGASWMAEYGDPDKPEEWAYISRYSPYQNLKPGTKYPTVMFTTTTRDDRVHPGHARKMAARMESMGIPFYYFENTEGGHGAGVTNAQVAKELALTYVYLWRQIGVEPRATP
ncbi:MAG TPA: prolyl oligopeptidase family serine peptidase [Gemmatimonadales bacterium]|nr:prolyl oligopeptidase family serine peptidase [Gemmatimonadales bacterium]